MEKQQPKGQQPEKKEKIDSTLFKDRSHFKREEYDGWLKSSEARKATGLSTKKTEELGKKLLNRKSVGRFIQGGEPGRILGELEKGRFRELTHSERTKAIGLLKKAFRK